MVNKVKKQTFSDPEVGTNSIYLTPLLCVACASRITDSELCPLENFGLVTSLHMARISLI